MHPHLHTTAMPTHVHTYVNSHMHAQRCAHTHAQTYMHTCAHASTRTNTHARTYAHTTQNMHLHTRHVHTHTHTHMYTCAHTARAYTHALAHTPPPTCPSPPPMESTFPGGTHPSSPPGLPIGCVPLPPASCRRAAHGERASGDSSGTSIPSWSFPSLPAPRAAVGRMEETENGHVVSALPHPWGNLHPTLGISREKKDRKQ